MRCKTSQVLLLLKIALFIGLSAVFYVFYFTTVAQKYAEGHTTVVVSQERMENGKKFPFLTLCMTPCAKKSVLEQNNVSLNALNEPNYKEKKILAKMNKTIEGLFREVAYKLNVDFEFYITLWFYEEDFGWKGYKGKMLEGDDNYIKVGAKKYLTSYHISSYSFRS